MNKYYLEPYIRDMVNAQIKAYPVKKKEYDNSIFKSKDMDGQPRGTGTSDVVPQEVSERIKIYDKWIYPVEQALLEIPKEYGQPIIDKIAYGTKEPDYAAPITWKRYRRKFRYFVALYAELI